MLGPWTWAQSAVLAAAVTGLVGYARNSVDAEKWLWLECGYWWELMQKAGLGSGLRDRQGKAEDGLEKGLSTCCGRRETFYSLVLWLPIQEQGRVSLPSTVGSSSCRMARNLANQHLACH